MPSVSSAGAVPNTAIWLPSTPAACRLWAKSSIALTGTPISSADAAGGGDCGGGAGRGVATVGATGGGDAAGSVCSVFLYITARSRAVGEPLRSRGSRSRSASRSCSRSCRPARSIRRVGSGAERHARRAAGAIGGENGNSARDLQISFDVRRPGRRQCRQARDGRRPACHPRRPLHPQDEPRRVAAALQRRLRRQSVAGRAAAARLAGQGRRQAL